MPEEVLLPSLPGDAQLVALPASEGNTEAWHMSFPSSAQTTLTQMECFPSPLKKSHYLPWSEASVPIWSCGVNSTTSCNSPRAAVPQDPSPGSALSTQAVLLQPVLFELALAGAVQSCPFPYLTPQCLWSGQEVRRYSTDKP